MDRLEWGNLSNKNFPQNFQLADASPIFEKKDEAFVENYRSVSVLTVVSKIFEWIIPKQISDYIGKFLRPFLRGDRKGFSTRDAVLTLAERCKLCLDKKSFAVALLMDLSKAFDTIDHELLIAKLHAYDFSTDALEVLLSYLQNRWQRVKISTTFSSWTRLLQGVPQELTLGPIAYCLTCKSMILHSKESIYVTLQMTQLRTFVNKI